MNVSIKVPAGGKISVPHYPIDMIATDERAKVLQQEVLKKLLS